MLRDFKIFKYPFMDTVAVKKFSLYGYNYMDIVTDGAINPKANYPAGLFEEDLFIEFENEDKLMIDKEVSNFPIRRYDRAVFYYRPWSAEPGAVQGGFGNLYIILKRYPVTIFNPPKENPYVSFTKIVAGEDIENFWLGKNKIDAGYELLIPYIPNTYKNLAYLIESNATSFKVDLHGYYTDINVTGMDVISVTANTYNLITLYPHTRYHLELENKDVGFEKNFHTQLTWFKNA